jgi:hypothetical protein
MSQVTTPRWASMQDEDSREVERVLRQEFPRTDAYRYNAASIRVRVIDERFRGKSLEERDGMVEPYIHQLPRDLQADIMRLLTLAPPDETYSFRDVYQNEDFENPDVSDL